MCGWDGELCRLPGDMNQSLSPSSRAPVILKPLKKPCDFYLPNLSEPGGMGVLAETREPHSGHSGLLTAPGTVAAEPSVSKNSS